MWERYCRGVSVIVFVVDSADRKALPVAKEEIATLMANETLEAIPFLVLGNKTDLQDKMSVDELIEALQLSNVKGREVSCCK
jgi:ADP-ribosylation factor-like protein 8